MNSIMKSKESKVLYYDKQFFHWADFISCIFHSVALYHTFYNNEYIIRSSLTNGVTDMGIRFFKKQSIKIIRLRKEIVLSAFH